MRGALRPPESSVPGISSGPDWLDDLESKEWFLLGDVAGPLRGLTSGIGLFTSQRLRMPKAGGLVYRRGEH